MAGFEKKIALVTGAAQGIGLAIARKLAAGGAKVHCADINLEAAGKSCETLKSEGFSAEPLALNVSDRSSCEGAVDGIMKGDGRIDLLVNNAGITRDGLLMRMKPEDWDAVIGVNLSGAFHLTQAVIKNMIPNRYGRIVNVASVVGLMGNPGQANYVASKAGLIGLTKVVAKELASRNITCNAIAPGFIVTAMTEKLDDKQKEQMASIIPMKRMGSAEDVANAAAFLLSDEASYITGQVLSVNGGMYM